MINNKQKFEQIIIETFAKQYPLSYSNFSDRQREILVNCLQQAVDECTLNLSNEIVELKDRLAGRWISVEDELPERGVKVLCIGSGGYYKVGAFFPENKYFSGDDSYNGITHWQPITPPIA